MLTFLTQKLKQDTQTKRQLKWSKTNNKQDNSKNNNQDKQLKQEERKQPKQLYKWKLLQQRARDEN